MTSKKTPCRVPCAHRTTRLYEQSMIFNTRRFTRRISRELDPLKYAAPPIKKIYLICTGRALCGYLCLSVCPSVCLLRISSRCSVSIVVSAVAGIYASPHRSFLFVSICLCYIPPILSLFFLPPSLNPPTCLSLAVSLIPASPPLPFCPLPRLSLFPSLSTCPYYSGAYDRNRYICLLACLCILVVILCHLGTLHCEGDGRD